MSNILINVLNLLFNLTNDWGMAIMGLTLGVKILLLPLSIKQKVSMSKQQKFTEGINDIKLKYKNNKSKMDEELTNYYTQNGSNMMGLFLSVVQLPIIMILFKVIRSINIDTNTILFPWVISLKSYDTSYIIPLIYTLLALSPNILNYIGFLKGYDESKPVKQNIITIIIISLMITARSPVAIGIYFITNSLVSFIEELIYRLIVKNKRLKQI